MRVVSTRLPEVLLIESQLFKDERGSLMEVWQEKAYAAAGLTERFVQDNLSRSVHGALRGLHFQHPRGQGKLIQVLDGVIFDVAVDVRRRSPRFGQWVSLELLPARQLWIPAGFAHGFCVLSESASVLYRCTDFYAPEAQHVIAWNDPDLAIPWPIQDPLLSARDRRAARLAEATVLPE